MEASKIRQDIQEVVASRNCFIVEITVSKDNDIIISIDAENGSVDMDDCVAINNSFTELYDRDKEDYSLTVTSAGLDQPFKVIKQFEKAVNTEVEVKFKGGKKIIGVLLSATEEEISLKYSEKENIEGKKKKVLVEKTEIFKMEDINSVMPYINIK